MERPCFFCHNDPFRMVAVALQPDVNANRFIAGGVLFVCLAALAAGLWLRPDEQGIGTHRQFGLPPCGFLSLTGLPCATCGCTTAFALAVDGQLLRAFVVQPAGVAFALAVAGAALLSGWCVLSGASLAPVGRFIWRPRFVILAAGLVLLAWLYKILLVTGVLA